MIRRLVTSTCMRWAPVIALFCYGDTLAAPSLTEDDVYVVQQSGSDASLRGLSVVSAQVAWCSGTGGTVLRTVDGGTVWQDVSVPDAESFDFRDIEAFDGRTAVALGAGSPAVVFRTEDGGRNWRRCYLNEHPQVFFDAMGFWDRQRGIAFSDPIEGRLMVILTEDGGRRWTPRVPAHRPAVHPGEAGFAASGTCLVVQEERHVWIGLGGGAEKEDTSARVFRSDDGGAHWQVAVTPMPATPTSGIFSLAFADSHHGVAVGGDYQRPDAAVVNSCVTEDGGRTWRRPRGTPPRGYRSAVAVLPNARPRGYVAVGLSGTDVSHDGGHSWSAVHDLPLHAIALSPTGVGWAVGPEGRILRWRTSRAPEN